MVKMVQILQKMQLMITTLCMQRIFGEQHVCLPTSITLP